MSSRGGVVLARRATVVVPLDVLVNLGLPPVCAVSGAPADETLPTRVAGRRTPLWLLLPGLAPYVVVRLILGSGGTGVRVQLPVTKAVADRLALARTGMIVAALAAFASLFAVLALGPAALALTALAVGCFAFAALVDSAMSVRPTLVQGQVVLEVSHQLRDAFLAATQRV